MEKKSALIIFMLYILVTLTSYSQPIEIKEVPLGSYGAFNALGNYYFFHNDSLWKSNGAASGTMVLKDLGSRPLEFETVEVFSLSTVFFFKTQSGATSYLWRSNGTGAGTTIVASYSALDFVEVYNNEFYYSALQSGIWKLFKVGTSTPVILKNLHATQGQVADGVLFLDVENGDDSELWKANGTVSGTIKLKDITVRNMETLNNELIFTTGASIWKSDGTTAGTVLIRSFDWGDIRETAVYNGRLYFSIDERYEMYVSDGTENGTTLLRGNLGVDVYVFDMGVANNQLFFTVDQQGPPSALWRSDGTPEGTFGIHRMPGSVRPQDVTVVANHVFYAMHDSVGNHGNALNEDNSFQLWQSDLTAPNTRPVRDFFPGTTFPGSQNLENVNNVLFFMSMDGGQLQLWKYNPNAPSASIPFFTVVDADTDQDKEWLKEDNTIVVYEGQNINIRFNPTVNPASVRFVLNGASYRVENVAPFALAGDNTGNYNRWPATEGSYTLVARQYSGTGASGTLLATTTIHFNVDIIAFPQLPIVNAGSGKSINFPANSVTFTGTASDPGGSISTVFWDFISGPQIPTIVSPNSLTTQVNNFSYPGTYWFRLSAIDNEGHLNSDDVFVHVSGISITGFELWNFGSGMGTHGIGVLGDYTLDLADYPNEFWNIIASTAGDVESVRLSYAGTTKVENVAPYALFGDTNGELVPGELTLGTHTLTATPYSGNNATGTSGLPLSIQLTVVNSAARLSVGSQSSVITNCYPNPGSDIINISLKVVDDGMCYVEIVDVTGRLREKLFDGDVYQGQDLQLIWKAKDVLPGVYILKVTIGGQEQMQKLVVR